MIITKKAESLAGIIIGVFILSFVLLGIGALLGSSNDLIDKFYKKMDLDLLNSRSYTIIDNLDLSSLYDGDYFYVHKNNSDLDVSKWTFDIHVGEQKSQYKYIDKYGNKIDNPNDFGGDVYSRTFQAKKTTYDGEEKTVVKALIKRLIK